MASIQVLCPLRDVYSNKWERIIQFLTSLPTMSKYYDIYSASSLHLELEQVPVTPQNARIIHLSLSILLTERCRFAPRPILEEMFFDDNIGFKLKFDTADSNLVKVIRGLVCGLAHTKYNPSATINLNVGASKGAILDPDSSDAKAIAEEVNRLTELVNNEFGTDDMMLPTRAAELCIVEPDNTFCAWNGSAAEENVSEEKNETDNGEKEEERKVSFQDQVD